MKKFAHAALLTAGLATLNNGCGGDTLTHNHYYCDDGAAGSTSSTSEEGAGGQAAEENPNEVCSKTLVGSLSCSNPKIIATLHDDEMIRVGEDLLNFESDGTSVVLNIIDENCDVLTQQNLEVGVSPDPEESISLTVLSAVPGSVDVEVFMPLIVAGTVNQGESLQISDSEETTVLAIHLDDLSVYPSDEPPAALLSLLEDDNVILTLDITEGSTELLTLGPSHLSVRAAAVSAGYTFAAKRAEIEVYDCDAAF